MADDYILRGLGLGHHAYRMPTPLLGSGGFALMNYRTGEENAAKPNYSTYFEGIFESIDKSNASNANFSDTAPNWVLATATAQALHLQHYVNDRNNLAYKRDFMIPINGFRKFDITSPCGTPTYTVGPYQTLLVFLNTTPNWVHPDSTALSPLNNEVVEGTSVRAGVHAAWHINCSFVLQTNLQPSDDRGVGAEVDINLLEIGRVNSLVAESVSPTYTNTAMKDLLATQA